VFSKSQILLSVSSLHEFCPFSKNSDLYGDRVRRCLFYKESRTESEEALQRIWQKLTLPGRFILTVQNCTFMRTLRQMSLLWPAMEC